MYSSPTAHDDPPTRRSDGGWHLALVLLVLSWPWRMQAAEPLPGTRPLEVTNDLSAQMVAGLDRWLRRETGRQATNRAVYWKRNFSSRAAYEKSIAPNREHLRRMIGAVDERVTNATLHELEIISAVIKPGERGAFSVSKVRWPVFDAVFAEGLWLRPTNPPAAGQTRPVIIALPDADQKPEMIAGLAPGVPPVSQFARHLAESGCEVLIPTLVSRGDEFSGNEKLKLFTNQPHREWLHRQSYEMGRHIIGYEVQKVLAALDAVQSRATLTRVGIVGYGEGGLIALYAAALDPRLEAAVVSGYFDAREDLWSEPIYRNVFGLLREFGDAEIASLVAPRKLILEFCPGPVVKGPPVTRPGRSGAASGKISPVEFNSFEAEGQRANDLTAKLPGAPFVQLVYGNEGMSVNYGSSEALSALLAAVGAKRTVRLSAAPTNELSLSSEESSARQRRAVRELEQFSQHLLIEAERTRDAKTVALLQDTNDFPTLARTNREFFWREIMGKIETPKRPANPRTRQIHDRPAWTGYEVMLEVFPDVFAWGVLLVPKDLKPGERRPVVVCQTGSEGLPEDTINEDPNSTGYKKYHAAAARLAERGFIVYAPHRPSGSEEKIRIWQRQAHPLGLSLCSVIIAQHEVATDWLAALPFVDPKRIAFYGLGDDDLSLRVPAVMDRYALSISSADFMDWVQKCISTELPDSLMFSGAYEKLEWNFGPHFNHAEMAGLMAPRPFMVANGRDDARVASEFAKVRRLYEQLGISDRTEIEFSNGKEPFNGTGAFRFLEKHLAWPSGGNTK